MKDIKKTAIPSPQSIPSGIADIASDLQTVCDFVRYGVSRFNESGLTYGHGTDNAADEAAFMVLEGLHLPIDSLEPYWNARLTMAERTRLAGLINRRAETRLPAPYLLNKAYIQGFPFYVDERVIVPRSFIAEILCREDGFSRIPDYNAVTSILDLCTGSGCLGIIAAHLFPNATVDLVDLSPDAIEVAKRNIKDYELEDRVRPYQGDLFAPLKGKKYDLIITNPPYVDREGMQNLPEEFRFEPEMALAAGDDGLDIVHRILEEAPNYLTNDGGIICELGRCGPDLSDAREDLPFLWLDTENSSGEVFWLKKKDFR
ncbi:MAG: 50S ribosomal protein L3 N(5)-glutamine methyltransferase [Micavibrio aeruginosavorus]|uniref:50S ribosomal protein L3 N(5)-glutamine methyltransferase n=1 Tax=Micavibrio aeruginosavorus TaxID=349221 RepID=A0A2W5PQG3_9BACT|nr:MAG: 50S ribosomal protein L3 N(5)-glutamine methyltransferase [Micavibrio aeruginosavorus]